MKEQLLKLAAKVDALTLRERAMLFAAATAMVLFLLYVMELEPKLARQRILQAELSQQHNQVAGIDAEVARMAQGFVADPDAATRARLEQLRSQIKTSSAALMAVQKGLVAPEKIVPLLDQLLRANGKLTLVSLRSLPVTGMGEATAGPGASLPAGPTAAPSAAQPGGSPAAGTPAAQPSPAAPLKPRELLYRHGVEIVLQGGYLDMVSYMEALEALPVQLFWGKARLDAGQYPNARLTLTLYTLSLDQKWMTL
jgi:MSHA biogenesis protein MshJ